MKSLWLLMGRLAYHLARPVMKALPGLYAAPRVRVALKSPDGNLLLVRTWFGAQKWAFPGGGVESGETLEAAAVREVREETGISIDPGMLHRVGEVTRDEGVKLHLVVFEADVANEMLPKLDRLRQLEITDRHWWTPGTERSPIAASVAWYVERHT